MLSHSLPVTLAIAILSVITPIQAQSFTDEFSYASLKPRRVFNPERCGPGIGNCEPGVCCSSQNYCGDSKDHCAAPDCQIDFGPGCDGNQKPGGMDTSKIPRPKPSKLAYGTEAGIVKCKTPNTVAITYDDGPAAPETVKILDLLERYQSKATFFINGHGKGRGMIDDPKLKWGNILKRMYTAGHQIGSHTWSHQNLDKISPEQRMNQIIWNEMAINNILGVIPTYMRPPYSACTDKTGCPKVMEELGYHISYFDLSTEDTVFGLPGQEELRRTMPSQYFAGNLTGGSSPQDRRLVIAHDLQPETADILTEFMLKRIQEKGMKAVTMGECLDEPPENWYRLASGEKFVPPQQWKTGVPASTPMSSDEDRTSTSPELNGSPGVMAPSSGSGSGSGSASSAGGASGTNAASGFEQSRAAMAGFALSVAACTVAYFF